MKGAVVPGFEILSTPNINCARKYFMLQFSGRADDLLFEISNSSLPISIAAAALIQRGVDYVDIKGNKNAGLAPDTTY